MLDMQAYKTLHATFDTHHKTKAVLPDLPELIKVLKIRDRLILRGLLNWYCIAY
jgi:hypothetical protein